MAYCPRRSTILQNFSPIAQTVYEICVTNVFHFLPPGGLTLGQSSPKGEKTWWTPSSTILQNFIALRQPPPEISVTKILRTKKQTSTPVIRTGVIPTCRSPSPPAVASLSHGPRDCPASLSHLANDRPLHYRFFTFGLGANPWAKVHQKGRRPGILIDLPSCKISSPYVNPRPRYPLPKFCGQTNKQ